MRTLSRETFIALRARRTAHQIATEIINPPIDLKQVYCTACGKMLRRDWIDRNDRIPCHRCCHVNIIPHELANRIRHELTYGSCVNPPQRVERIVWNWREVLGAVGWSILLMMLIGLMVFGAVAER